MADREKVICAIKNCIAVPKCRDCPWEECEEQHVTVDGIPLGLIREALALLEEQEPRVMTLDEVRNLINIPRWAEYYVSVGSGEPVIQAGWALVQYEGADEEHFVDFATAWGLERWHVAVYGNRWRMWTARPTDEQRKETPWL